MNHMPRLIVMGRGGGRGLTTAEDSRWSAMLKILQQPNQAQHTACLADLQEWLSYATEASIGHFPLEVFVAALFDLLEGKPAASPFPRASAAEARGVSSFSSSASSSTAAAVEPPSDRRPGARQSSARREEVSARSQEAGEGAAPEGGGKAAAADPCSTPRDESKQAVAGETETAAAGGAGGSGEKKSGRRGRSSSRPPSEHKTPTEEAAAAAGKPSGSVASPRAEDEDRRSSSSSPSRQRSAAGGEEPREGNEGTGLMDEGTRALSHTVLVFACVVLELLVLGGGSGGEGNGGQGEGRARSSSNLAFDFGSVALRFGFERSRDAAGFLLGDDDDDTFALGRMRDDDEELLLLQQQALLLGDDEDGDGMVQKMLLVANCLFLLLDLLPVQGAAAIARQPRYLRILNSKLTSIEYIDLAEKILQCMDKLSEEQPLSVFLSGGLQASLSFLDFFSLDVQRRTMKAAVRLFKTAQTWSTSPCPLSRASSSRSLSLRGGDGGARAEEEAQEPDAFPRASPRAERRGLWRRSGGADEGRGGGQEGGAQTKGLAPQMEKSLEQQKEELKSLVSPVLPALSALLTYEDETLVSCACQCWRSYIDSLVSLHLRTASASPPPASLPVSPLPSSPRSASPEHEGASADGHGSSAAAASEPAAASVDSLTALQHLCRRFGAQGVGRDFVGLSFAALSPALEAPSGVAVPSRCAAQEDEEEEDECRRWIEEAGKKYRAALTELPKELNAIASSSLVPNLLALIARHVDLAVVAARAASSQTKDGEEDRESGEENEEEGMASLQQNACVTDAAYSLAVLANFSTNLAEELLRDPRWKSVERVMHATGEGPDFMLLLRFVCLGVSLLPAVVFNLPLFFHTLRLDSGASASPRKKKKRASPPAFAAEKVPRSRDRRGRRKAERLSDGDCDLLMHAEDSLEGNEQANSRQRRPPDVPRKLARVLVPDAERSRLFVKEPELFGTLIKTFVGPLLRLYDRALSSELLLETLQFLLGCVMTASVAEEAEDSGGLALAGSEERESTVDARGDVRETAGTLQAPAAKSLREELLAQLDSVQVAEFLAYILQTKPSATAVMAALSVTLELLSLAPHVFLPVFFKEGVIAFVRGGLDAAIDDGAFASISASSLCPSSVSLPLSALSSAASSRQSSPHAGKKHAASRLSSALATPHLPLSAPEDEVTGRRAPSRWRASMERQASSDEETETCALPLRWCFAFSSSGHVAVNLSRLSLWLSATILLLPAVQATHRCLSSSAAVHPLCSAGDAHGKDEGAADETGAGDPRGLAPLSSAIRASDVLPRLQQVTALLSLSESAAHRGPEAETQGEAGGCRPCLDEEEEAAAPAGLESRAEGAAVETRGHARAWKAFVSLRELLEGDEQVSAFEFIVSDVAAALAEFLGGLDVASTDASDGEHGDAQVQRRASGASFSSEADREETRALTCENAREGRAVEEAPEKGEKNAQRAAARRGGACSFFPACVQKSAGKTNAGTKAAKRTQLLHERLCLFLRAFAFSSALPLPEALEDLSSSAGSLSSAAPAASPWEDLDWSQADGALLLQLASLCMKSLGRAGEASLSVQTVFSASDKHVMGSAASYLPPHLRPATPAGFVSAPGRSSAKRVSPRLQSLASTRPFLFTGKKGAAPGPHAEGEETRASRKSGLALAPQNASRGPSSSSSAEAAAVDALASGGCSGEGERGERGPAARRLPRSYGVPAAYVSFFVSASREQQDISGASSLVSPSRRDGASQESGEGGSPKTGKRAAESSLRARATGAAAFFPSARAATPETPEDLLTLFGSLHREVFVRLSPSAQERRKALLHAQRRRARSAGESRGAEKKKKRGTATEKENQRGEGAAEKARAADRVEASRKDRRAEKEEESMTACSGGSTNSKRRRAQKERKETEANDLTRRKEASRARSEAGRRRGKDGEKKTKKGAKDEIAEGGQTADDQKTSVDSQRPSLQAEDEDRRREREGERRSRAGSRNRIREDGRETASDSAFVASALQQDLLPVSRSSSRDERPGASSVSASTSDLLSLLVRTAADDEDDDDDEDDEDFSAEGEFLLLSRYARAALDARRFPQGTTFSADARAASTSAHPARAASHSASPSRSARRSGAVASSLSSSLRSSALPAPPSSFPHHVLFPMIDRLSASLVRESSSVASGVGARAGAEADPGEQSSGEGESRACNVLHASLVSSLASSWYPRAGGAARKSNGLASSSGRRGGEKDSREALPEFNCMLGGQAAVSRLEANVQREVASQQAAACAAAQRPTNARVSPPGSARDRRVSLLGRPAAPPTGAASAPGDDGPAEDEHEGGRRSNETQPEAKTGETQADREEAEEEAEQQEEGEEKGDARRTGKRRRGVFQSGGVTRVREPKAGAAAGGGDTKTAAGGRPDAAAAAEEEEKKENVSRSGRRGHQPAGHTEDEETSDTLLGGRRRGEQKKGKEESAGEEADEELRRDRSASRQRRGRKESEKDSSQPPQKPHVARRTARDKSAGSDVAKNEAAKPKKTEEAAGARRRRQEEFEVSFLSSAEEEAWASTPQETESSAMASDAFARSTDRRRGERDCEKARGEDEADAKAEEGASALYGVNDLESDSNQDDDAGLSVERSDDTSSGFGSSSTSEEDGEEEEDEEDEDEDGDEDEDDEAHTTTEFEVGFADASSLVLDRPPPSARVLFASPDITTLFASSSSRVRSAASGHANASAASSSALSGGDSRTSPQGVRRLISVGPATDVSSSASSFEAAVSSRLFPPYVADVGSGGGAWRREEGDTTKKRDIQLFVDGTAVPSHMTLTEALCRYRRCFPSARVVRRPRSSAFSARAVEQRSARSRTRDGRRQCPKPATAEQREEAPLRSAARDGRGNEPQQDAEAARRGGNANADEHGAKTQLASSFVGACCPASCAKPEGSRASADAARGPVVHRGGVAAPPRESSNAEYAVVDLSARFLVAADADLLTLPCQQNGGSKPLGFRASAPEGGGEDEAPEEDVYLPLWDLRHVVEYEVLEAQAYGAGAKASERAAEKRQAGTPQAASAPLPASRVPSSSRVSLSLSSSSTSSEFATGGRDGGRAGERKERHCDAGFLLAQERRAQELLEGRASPLLCTVVDSVFGSSRLLQDLRSFAKVTCPSRPASSASSSSTVARAGVGAPLSSPAELRSLSSASGVPALEPLCSTPERRKRVKEELRPALLSATARQGDVGPRTWPLVAPGSQESSLVSAFEDAVSCMAFLRGSLAAPPRQDILLCAGSDEAAELVYLRARSLARGAPRDTAADLTAASPEFAFAGEAFSASPASAGSREETPCGWMACEGGDRWVTGGGRRNLFGHGGSLGDIFGADKTAASLVFLLTLLHHLVYALRRMQLERAFVAFAHDTAAFASQLRAASPLSGSLASPLGSGKRLSRPPATPAHEGASQRFSGASESSKGRTRRRRGTQDSTSSSASLASSRSYKSAPSLIRLSEAQLGRFFTNSALSLKLLQVLSDPALVVSLCPPLWVSRLLRGCSFLFPFSARMLYVFQTFLGLNRSLCCYGQRLRDAMDTVAARGAAGSGSSLASSRGGGTSGARFASLALPPASPLVAAGGATAVGGYGAADPTSRALMATLAARIFSQIEGSRRQQQSFVANLETAVALPRTKVKIHRTRILDSAFKVMEHFHSLLYSSKNGSLASQQQPLLEVEYFGEEGVGSGPTIEFYSEVLEAIQTHSAPRLFRDVSSDGCFFPFPYSVDLSRLAPALLSKPLSSSLTSSSGAAASMTSAMSPSSSPVRPSAHPSPRSASASSSLSAAVPPPSSATPSRPTPRKAPEGGNAEARRRAGREGRASGEGHGTDEAEGLASSPSSSRGSATQGGAARDASAAPAPTPRGESGDAEAAAGRQFERPDRTPRASQANASSGDAAIASSSSLVVSAASSVEEKVFLLFKLLGQVAAKALLDGRSCTIDLRLHPAFWQLALQRESCTCGACSGALQPKREHGQDPGSGRGVAGGQAREAADAKKNKRGARPAPLDGDGLGRGARRQTRALARRQKEQASQMKRAAESRGGEEEKEAAGRPCRACLKTQALGLADLNDVDEQLARSMQRLLLYRSEGNEVEDLALVFVLPGTDIELVEGGSNLAVCNGNLDFYIRRVIQVVLLEGILLQAYAFRFGFSTLVPLSSLSLFSPQERAHLVFGGGGRIGDSRFWNIEHLRAHIVPDHGFTASSATYVSFLEVLTEFSVDERRRFLRFATGTPVLPHGGFAALRPLMKVVRKPQESGSEGATSDDVLPSVMTCTNYIKLPDYSSKRVLRLRLVVAMTEGQGAFTLS
ncbi:hypothetical protein BESB_019030 [Besnoitia besnoiti]|uniref:HECT domain-containing protein n=1 Tax=Besnoitia besnoiti TaxID=94643 RepID=A0A2A9M9A2_BESBE|nr:hypothetical protein BESB_019030 [Besnoitia besnoiti]PFH31962.1 hypothetical protein BESB_019030 [Besnoitia besnoiti]